MTPHQFVLILNSSQSRITKMQPIGLVDKYFTHFPTWMGCSMLGNLTKRGYILVPWDTHLIMYIHLLRIQDRKMDMARNSINRF